MDGQTDKPLVVCDNGLVVVGGQRSDANGRGANTKLVVNGDVEFAGGGSFKLTGIEFSTTSGGTSRNILEAYSDGSSTPRVNICSRNMIVVTQSLLALTPMVNWVGYSDTKFKYSYI